jgi:hypothetical protein
MYLFLINEIYLWFPVFYNVEKNQDKIDWIWLSINPNAISLLEKNQDKILVKSYRDLISQRISRKSVWMSSETGRFSKQNAI